MTEQQKRKRAEVKPYNVVGKFFATLRIQEDLSVEQWAEKTGLSAQSLTKIERGDVTLTVEQALALSKGLKDYPDYATGFTVLVVNTLGVVILSILPEQIQKDLVDVALGNIVLEKEVLEVSAE